MAADPRRVAALKVLAATGMWRSTYAPPSTRLLWLLGVNVRPPHFASFATNAWMFGASFGIFFGLMIRLIEGRSLAASLVEIVVAGTLFGLFMARAFAWGRRKYDLPDWQSL